MTIHELKEHVGAKISLSGWVYNSRSSGKITFLQVRDGFGFCQAIVDESKVTPAVWQAAQQVTPESSVRLTGTVSKHPKKEEYELQVEELEIVQLAAEYPISKKEHGVDFLMDHRHLWLRSPAQWAISACAIP